MRYWLKIGFLSFLALVIQTSLNSRLVVQGVKPDLLLILTVFIALENGSDSGGVYGVTAGLFLDLLGGGIVGSNALAKTLIGSALGFLRKLVFEENRFVKLVLVFFASVIHDSITYTVYYILSRGNAYVDPYLIIFPAALYNMALAVLLLPLFGEGKR